MGEKAGFQAKEIAERIKERRIDTTKLEKHKSSEKTQEKKPETSDIAQEWQAKKGSMSNDNKPERPAQQASPSRTLKPKR